MRTKCTGKFCGVSAYLGVPQNVSPLHEFITTPTMYHLGCEWSATRSVIRLNLPGLLTCIILRYDNLNLPASNIRIPQINVFRRGICTGFCEEMLLTNVTSCNVYTAYHKIKYVMSLNWVALPCAIRQPKWFQVWPTTKHVQISGFQLRIKLILLHVS